MVVYPSLCFHEQNLVIPFDGIGAIRYLRAGIGLAPRPDAAPVAPVLGSVIVAYITQSGSGGRPGGYWPLRCFYLSTLAPEGHLEGVTWPGKGDGGTLVRPDSITPRVPHCERATQFGRNPHAAHIENRLANWLEGNRRAWQRYSEQNGFVLPVDHREVFDGDKIPF